MSVLATFAIVDASLAAIESGIRLFQKLKETAKQGGELTPEQEAVLDARLEKAFQSDHWKTDEQLTPPPATSSETSTT